MGRAGGAGSERERGIKPGDPEEPATTAGEPTAKNRGGQVPYFHTVWPSDLRLEGKSCLSSGMTCLWS